MIRESAAQRIAKFKPEQLLRAENEVQAAHPNTCAPVADIGPDIVEELRQLLRSTGEENLLAIARALAPRQFRALLQLLCLNEDDRIHERAAAIIRLRPRRDLTHSAWWLLLAHYPVAHVESIVRYLTSKFGYPWLADQDKVRRIDRWLSAGSITEGILEDIEDCLAGDVDRFLTMAEVPEWSPLRAAVWRELLGGASSDLIVRIGPTAMLRRAEGEPVVVQQRFAANYLCRLGNRSAWHTQVLRWIREKYGVPPLGENQTLFWRRIPDQIRREFRRWANETTIKEFFEKIHDPHGRFLFWREYIEEMEEARIVIGNQAMLMDFGHFGVIEFSQVGNAAYIYKAADFARIRNLNPYTSPAAFKDPMAAHMRIIHRQGWEWEYKPRIERLLRR